MTTKQLMATLTELGVKYKREFEEARLGVREATSEADEILCRGEVIQSAARLDAIYEACDALGLWAYDEAAEVIADEYARRIGPGAEDEA